jgi:hypothetical protein
MWGRRLYAIQRSFTYHYIQDSLRLIASYEDPLLLPGDRDNARQSLGDVWLPMASPSTLEVFSECTGIDYQCLGKREQRVLRGSPL